MRPAVLLLGLVALPSCCGRAPPPPDAPPESADAAALLAHLRPTLPPGFTAVVQEPWLVLGDEAPDDVRRRARSTVAWADRLLRRELFARGPDRPLAVWLFRDAESYRSHCQSLFGEEPRTPFGYFSPAHDALIMDISTGGGTLVHEMVHPFVRADFPDCPAWFNEGLGSLYEQCGEEGGRIRGRPNWRLPALQQALRSGAGPRLRDLVALDDAAFYAGDAGLHYAAARYLCLWLQEAGLLPRYYRAFRDGVAADPSGWTPLVDVLGDRDSVTFQAEWEEWVAGLTYP